MPDETLRPDPARHLLVLVVEGEPLIALEFEMILEENGHVVLGPVTSIDKALSLLEDTKPEVALLDVNVRGQLVIPVAERLHSLSVPFVLSSAYSSVDFSGGDVFKGAENVGKPFCERRLLEALDRAMESA